MLSIDGLVAGYQHGSRVLDGVSFHIRRGEIVALMGRNGMGKTTVLRAITGHLPAAKGTITLESTDILGRPRRLLERGNRSGAQNGLLARQRWADQVLSARRSSRPVLVPAGQAGSLWQGVRRSRCGSGFLPCALAASGRFLKAPVECLSCGKPKARPQRPENVSSFDERPLHPLEIYRRWPGRTSCTSFP